MRQKASATTFEINDLPIQLFSENLKLESFKEQGFSLLEFVYTSTAYPRFLFFLSSEELLYLHPGFPIKCNHTSRKSHINTTNRAPYCYQVDSIYRN